MHVAQDGTNSQRWKVVAVVAVAVGLRVLLPLFALAIARTGPQFREPDSETYLRVADEWLQTGRFAVLGKPEILRTPGYPFLLLPGIAVGRVDLVTIALQVLLACLTVWLVYRIAMLVSSQKTALIAAWLFACEPLSVLYTSKLLGETFFTTLVTAALFLLALYVTSQSWRPLLAAAACVSAAAYVRPVAYYLPVWLALSLLLVLWRQASDRRRLALHATGFLALATALVAPWQVRNWIEAGYAGFAAISDQNLYFYEALPILAEHEGLAPAQSNRARREAGELDMAVYLRRHPEQAGWTAAAHYRYLRREALRTIRAHPLAWARIHWSGMLLTLTDSGRNGWLSFFGLLDTSSPSNAAPPRGFWQRLTAAASRQPLVLAIHLLLAAILATYLLLALAGILSSLRQSEALLLFSAALYLLLLSGGDAGYH
ncbi:MAG: ArnT family glycosyltransferase, partial [Pirellulales bacterium]